MSPRIVAHRGASATHPENTMASFAAAVEAGADLIELDVQASADGELIVLHDFELDRTTTGKGLAVSRTVDYIRELDAGSWFGSEFRGEQVPLLSDVFEQFAGQVQFEIELKGFSADFVHAVMEMILNLRVSDDVFTTSNQLPLLLLAQEQHPDTRVGLFAPPHEAWMSKGLWQALTLTHAQLLDGESIHAPVNLLDSDFVERLHDLDLDVHASGCNSAAEVRKAVDLEVDEFSTDDPAMARELVPEDELD